MDEILEYMETLRRDPGPMFQIDETTGRVYRRGPTLHEWEIHEEVKK